MKLKPIVKILTMYYFEAMTMGSKLLKLALPLLGLLCFAACGKTTQNHGVINKLTVQPQKIVGGFEVASSTLVNNLFVIIISDNQGTPQVCTGTFISSHHILTAAHCVNETVDDLSLVTGVNPLGNEEGLVLTPTHVVRHEKYNKNSIMERNDIAIITVAETIALAANDFPQLPDSELAAKMTEMPSLQFLAVGYGKTAASIDDTGRSEGVLRSVRLKTSFKNSAVLEIDQTYGRGVCYGDSGGPALMLHHKTHYVVGVASAISREGNNDIDECRAGGIYMNIIPYISWIQDIISK